MMDTDRTEHSSFIERCVTKIEHHHDELIAFTKELKAAARPFLAAASKPDSDCDDGEIELLTVTRGDIRRLQMAMNWRR